MGFRQQHRKLYTSLVALTLFCIVSIIDGIILAEYAIHPPREESPSSTVGRIFPRNLEIVEDPVEIRGQDGIVLRATYAQPFSADNGSTVIVLHGVADDRSGMIGFARLFLANGYRVLLPDSRAQGGSDGRLASYGVLERDDVHRWVDWASATSHGACVYGMGESMGAAILLQAIGNDQRMCAAVAESAFATFRQISEIRVGQFTHTGPWLGKTLARPMIDSALWYVRLRYGVDLGQANPLDTIAKTCTPVLLIHGLSDSNIPPSSAVELHRAALHSSELWLVPNAGHCGASAVDKTQFDERVLRWFGQHATPCQ